ncbi:unnamed protein product [Blepharisma stoltei]|uniref:Uncharacterized protein n=1 Tax=Blepharisma stoltei TaxID=1481888 RepID=A0AAU9J5Z9_9CILI|nr:unnamed protein product [Blepharisma stoltei]
MGSSEEEIVRLQQEVEHWKSLYFQSLQRTQELEAQLGISPKEYKPPGHERPHSNRQEDHKSSQTKNKQGPKYIKKQDHQLDHIKNKLRLACSNNDKALLEEAIKEAELAGMSDIDHAKRKLASLI